MSGMRVGLIAPPWVPVPPARYGGTEAVIDRLARGLARRGCAVTLFATGDSSCPVERRWVYRQAQWRVIGDLHTEARHVLQAYEQLSGFDVVHDHTTLGPLLGDWQAPVRVAVTHHGPFDEQARRVFGEHDGRMAVVAISHHHASSAGNVRIARVIHHGLDVATFPFSPQPDDYFLFLGRMAPEKGAREAAWVARQAGVRLLMAAKMREPSEVRYFLQAVRPLLTDRIKYIGEVDSHQKASLLGGAVALLNPISWPEPFGLVMIESLAAGTPVLTFRRGAAPEIVDDGTTGFLCDDMADMLGRVDDVRLLRRADCRRAVEQRFSTDRMVDDHLALYTELLDRDPAAAGSPADM